MIRRPGRRSRVAFIFGRAPNKIGDAGLVGEPLSPPTHPSSTIPTPIYSPERERSAARRREGNRGTRWAVIHPALIVPSLSSIPLPVRPLSIGPSLLLTSSVFSLDLQYESAFRTVLHFDSCFSS